MSAEAARAAVQDTEPKDHNLVPDAGARRRSPRACTTRNVR